MAYSIDKKKGTLKDSTTGKSISLSSVGGDLNKGIAKLQEAAAQPSSSNLKKDNKAAVVSQANAQPITSVETSVPTQLRASPATSIMFQNNTTPITTVEPQAIAATPAQPVSFFSLAGQKNAWDRLTGSYELIGRKVGNMLLPGQPFGDLSGGNSSTMNLRDKATNFVTSPGFLLAAPAAAAAAWTLAAPAAAAGGATTTAASGSAAAATGAAATGGGILGLSSLKSLGLVGGLGLLGGFLLGGGSSQKQDQNLRQDPTQITNPTVTPTITPTVTPDQSGDNGANQGTGSPFIRDSPGANFYYAPNNWADNSRVQNTTTNSYQLTNTYTTSNQELAQTPSQSASSGLDPMLLIGAALLAAVAFRD